MQKKKGSGNGCDDFILNEEKFVDYKGRVYSCHVKPIRLNRRNGAEIQVSYDDPFFWGFNTE